MKRAAFLLLLLAALMWWASRERPSGSAGLAIEGGADGVGAGVYVNGHAIGRMQHDRRGGAPASRLDVRVPLRRSNEIVFVSARGVRLVSRAPLGDSMLVSVSFTARRLTMTPAGAGAAEAVADTLDEYDD